MLMVEVPTNPDMKVPDLTDVVRELRSYVQKTGKRVLLLLDVTFAPNAQVLGQCQKMDADLPVMAFISLSKSVSRGYTTAGTMVANHTQTAIDIIHGVHAAGATLDTCAKDDQLRLLCDNHRGVEERNDNAYNVAKAAGKVLTEAVQKATGQKMHLRFPSDAQAARGFTSPTFSFNLPPKGDDYQVNAALAQDLVDLLVKHKGFKPCVSFGQDNGLVYCTVPATSTQGAIKAEHTDKQAVGGVQLTRLSFPPTCDLEHVKSIIADSVAKLYK
jgi:cysteine synthase A